MDLSDVEKEIILQRLYKEGIWIRDTSSIANISSKNLKNMLRRLKKPSVQPKNFLHVIRQGRTLYIK